MAALNWGPDPSEPSGLHTAACAIWQTNEDPCDCDPPAQRPIPRLTLAELIDLIQATPKGEST